MSLFGRLKTAIKGNPVIKEHEIGKHLASAGPGLLWKVYDGIKKTTQQEVSIFIFNKHTPEVEKLPKDHKEELFEMLKKGPNFLAKLRHPKVLTLHHTVEESSDCIAFTTEPVFASLSNVLGHYENVPTPLPLSIKEFQLHGVEAHYGILQVAEALGFLHNDVKLIHGNLTPENVMLNKKGEWKLMGFNFASYDNYQSSAQTTFHFKEFNSQRSFSTNPQLDYLAPEYIMTGSFDVRSDLYSFGMLAYSLYNGGKPLYENHNNTLTFKHSAEQISRMTESGLGDTPTLLRPLVRELLAIEPSVRPDALQILKHVYFDDVLVSTLKYLDSLYSKSDMEKSQWFKSVLGKMVIKLPKRVVHQKVVPALVAEFRNHKMIPFVLPIVLLIADDCTMYEYSSLILPALIPVFKIHNPIQIPLIILQKMDLILKKTSPDEMKRHILPMILATLESDNNQVQELCVSILPNFADMIDYSSMKHSIVPRITSLSVSSPSVSLSIKCLVTLGQIVHTLDKEIVLEQVLPVIVKIPSREPGVLMGILGIFHKAMTEKNIGFEKQLIATRVLPFLIPLSIQTTLNQNQFNQFMMIIKELLKKMETEHNQYLQQVAKMEEQTKSTVEFAREVSSLKATEDALKGIESLSGAERSDNDLITNKFGSGGHNKTVPLTNTMGGEDLFAGLSTSKSPEITKATPTMSSMKKLNFSESQSSSTPPMNHQPMGTWEVPNCNTTQPTSDLGLFTGMSVSNVSTVQSHRTATQAPLSRGSDILKPTHTSSFTGNQFNVLERSHLGSSDTSGTSIFTPQQQTTPSVKAGTQIGNTNAAMNMTNTATSTQSFFTPVETSRGSDILKPTNASSFTGNQFNISEGFQIGSSGTPGTGNFIPQQQNMAFVKVGTQDGNSKEALNMMPNTAGSTQSFFAPVETDILHPPSLSNARAGPNLASNNAVMGIQSSNTGILQPSPAASAASWSSNISNEPAGNVGGWSSTISNEPVGNVGGWSSNIGNEPVGNVGGWSSNISSGWSNQGDQSASTSQNAMLGWSSSIQPLSTWGSAAGGSGFGQFEAQTGRNIGSSAGSNSSNKGAVGMAPGPNPFAEFDSLI